MDRNRARITIKLGQAKDGVQAPPSANSVERKTEPRKMEETELARTETGSAGKDEPLHSIAGQEEMAAGEEFPEDFESFGPKYIPKDERESRSISTKRRSYKSRFHTSREINARQLLRVMASVCGAVAVGLVFGFIVLTFFKSGFMDAGKPLESIESTVKSGQDMGLAAQTNTETEPVSAVEPSSSGEAETMKVSITLPAKKIYAVQGGVFQDRESAKPILDKIKSKGWPNYFSGDKPAYLFLGLAAKRDHALSMANQFKDMDVYIKEIEEESETVSVSVKKASTLSQEEWEQWSQAEETFRNHIGETIDQGLTAGKLDEAKMKALKDSHLTLLRQGRELFSKMPGEQQSAGNRILNDYTKSVSAMDRYQKQPADGYLWQAEQALLDAFENRKNLISSFRR